MQCLASATIIATLVIEVCKNIALPFALVLAFCLSFVLALPFALAIVCLHVLLGYLGLDFMSFLWLYAQLELFRHGFCFGD